MREANARWLLITFSVMTIAGLSLAQEPRLSGGRAITRSAAAGLEREFRALSAGQEGPVWIGYSVPIIPGDHRMCCGDSDSSPCCGKCLLEGRAQISREVNPAGPVRLEAGGLHVLFRVEHRQVQKLRSFSADCELDTGGMTLFWLTDVRSKDSTLFLASFIDSSPGEDVSKRRLTEGALAAIALHDDESADRVLESLAGDMRSEFVREKVSFWLGAARGRRGYDVLRRMIHDDPSIHVREQVVFALSLSHEAEAVETMIETAKYDKSEQVRGQALFWLAQKAGKKAGEAITGAVENDPDTQVRKKAVFALSQLPADDGIPRLIQLARTHKDRAVRKEAIFWLGQSRDPRALSFFEEILR